MDDVRKIALSSGLKLAYAERGSPGGVPLLLLHGYTDSCRSYDRLMDCLPKVDRAVALSLRGHGDSDKPDSGYDLATLAADCAEAMDRLGIGAAIVVGHSMGSQVALRLALDHPGRVRGLVLLGGFATLAGNPAVIGLGAEVVTLTDPVDPAFVRDFQQSTLARPIDAGFLEAQIEASLKVPARIWQACVEMQLLENLGDRLPGIAAPALVLWGDQDAICDRASQDRLCQGLADATLAVYRGTGHAIHWERPDEVAADIARFTGRLETSARRTSRPAAG